MPRKTLPLAAACALLAASAAPAQRAKPRAPATAKPPAVTSPERPPLEHITDEIFNHEFKDLDGRSLLLSNFRGRVLVINIWATWCGPCRLEVPQLNKLYEEYAARGVVFVGLTTEDPKFDAERVRDFVAHFEMKYPVAWADRETALTLLDGRTNIPQTLVVMPGGRIHTRFVGFSPKKSPRLTREAIAYALGDVK